jgi:hypothetical protein
VISGRQLHGQEALTNQFMYYAQSTALSRAVHGVPIPVRCTVCQSPCGARCANPRAPSNKAGLGIFSLPPFQASRLVTSVATICFVILGVLSTRILSGSRTRKMVYSLFPQIPVTSTHSHTVHT